MTARARMTMRADLQWISNASAEDDYGQPAPPTWETTSAGISLYAWSERKRDLQTNGIHVVVEDLRAIVPRGIAIQDEWRLLNVHDRRSNEIFAGPLYVDAIQVLPTHLELTLNKVGSGADKDL